jgi:hypothetical protein
MYVSIYRSMIWFSSAALENYVMKKEKVYRFQTLISFKFYFIIVKSAHIFLPYTTYLYIYMTFIVKNFQDRPGKLDLWSFTSPEPALCPSKISVWHAWPGPDRISKGPLFVHRTNLLDLSHSVSFPPILEQLSFILGRHPSLSGGKSLDVLHRKVAKRNTFLAAVTSRSCNSSVVLNYTVLGFLHCTPSDSKILVLRTSAVLLFPSMYWPRITLLILQCRVLFGTRFMLVIFFKRIHLHVHRV